MEEFKQTKKKVFELTEEFVLNLREIIISKNEQEAIAILDALHAADIADIYDKINIEEAKFLYLLLEEEKAADVIAELDDDDREKFLNALPSSVIARKFIKEMDSDDAADVIGDMSEERQEEVLAEIEDHEQAGDIVDLLSYHEDSAGGLMAKELVSINQNLSVKRSLLELRKQAKDVDEIYYIYVTDNRDHLIGTLSLKKLLLSNSKKSEKQGQLGVLHDVVG